MEVVLERVLNALPASLVLVVLAAVLLRLVRGLSAATRHAAWWVVLAMLVLLPFRPDSGELPFIELGGAPPAPDSAAIHMDSAAPSLQWLGAAVFTITALLLLRLAAHFLMLHYRKWRAPKLDAARVNEWRARGFVWRRVTLRESPRVDSPLVCGYLLPSIVLPKDFAQRTDAGDLDHVLLHELGHVARLDDFTQLFTRVIQAVAWWHPLVHIVIRQIEVEREAACDDWAVAVTGAPQGYAASLTRLMERRLAVEESMLAPGIGGRASHFSRRIERLVSPLRNPSPRFAFGALGVAISMLTAFALGATRLPAVVVFADESRKTQREEKGGFLESLALAGYKTLSVDEIIQLRSQGVPGRFVQETTAALGASLTPAQLVELHHRRVTPAQLKAAKKYGPKLTIEQIIRLRDAGAL